MKNRILKFAIVSVSLLFTACLEDDKQPLDPQGYNNVIEWYNVSIPISDAGAVYPAWAVSFPEAPSTQFELIISYSGPSSNDKDIVVDLEVNAFALDAYNEEAHTSYVLLPTDLYEMPTSATIPKGETKVTVPFTVYSSQFDFSLVYALPLSIVSSSSGLISSNFGTGIFVTVAKNKYDGAYHSTGYFQHPSSPRAIDRDKEMITTAKFVNQTEFADLGSAVQYAVDQVDNTVTFVGTVPQSAYMLPPATINGLLYDNTYDPTTRTYRLYYQYSGAGGFRTTNEYIAYVAERE